MMFTKRQHQQQQEQRQRPPVLELPPPPVPPIVGIVPAPWNLNCTTTNMEQLLELEDDDDDESSTIRHTHHLHDCDKYAIVGPFQHHYLPHRHQQQQQQAPPPPPPPRQQHQTLYVYLSSLLQRIGQASSPVDRYRSLQELHAILSSSSSSSSTEALSQGDGRVEMLLNHSGDSVLCWQLAYITQSSQTTTTRQQHNIRRHHQQQKQQGGGVDVAVLALLLECLALIWTPKSSSSSPSLSAPAAPLSSSTLHLDSRVQSMKQAAHTTLPILLQLGDLFAKDARIQKPLLFILRLYTKIRHVPTKSMLVKSGLVVHLRLALQSTRARLLDDDVGDAAAETFQQEATSAAAAAARHGNNNNNNQDENSLVPCILGLMKDLLFRAESTEKLYMYEEWHTVVLCGAAATTTPPRRYYMSSRLDEADQVASAEAISACLWNWAVSDELARRMAQNPAVWETLQDFLWSMPKDKQQQQQPQMPHLLASPRDQEEDDDEQQQQYPSSSSSNHHDNMWAHVHRNALAALGTMIASCTVTTRLFDSINNNNNETTMMTAVLQKQAWLVPCLCQILDRNEDKDSRRRCIRTLRCLSSCSWGRAFLLLARPPPDVVLPNSSSHNSSSTVTLGSSQQQHQNLLTLFLRCLQRQDEEVDTRIQASLAFAALLPSCQASEWMAMGPYFETALVQTIEDAAADSDDKLVLTAIQALQVCLDHNPWKRGGSGCFSHLFFESTLRVLRNQMSEPSYHAAFASLILHLVNQKKSTNSGGDKSLTILICPPVAEILSTLLTPLGPDFEASRSEALRAIVDLTTLAATTTTSNGQNVNDDPNDAVVVVVDNENYRKNLKTLAANECLLNNLVNLCLIAPSFKDQAKSAILKLVPEL